jgi:hypothetical protein
MTMRRWVDWVNVMLAGWLVGSPWLLASGDQLAAWSAWSVGAAIVMLALFAMYKVTLWGDAIALLLGAWLTASPWLLGFGGAARANAAIIGMLVVGYALWAMNLDSAADDGAVSNMYRRRAACTRA